MRVDVGDGYLIMENGLLHCVEGPAFVHADGTVEYYQYGKLHRADGPARIYKNGIKELWFNGEYQGQIDREGIFWPWTS